VPCAEACASGPAKAVVVGSQMEGVVSAPLRRTSPSGLP